MTVTVVLEEVVFLVVVAAAGPVPCSVHQAAAVAVAEEEGVTSSQASGQH